MTIEKNEVADAKNAPEGGGLSLDVLRFALRNQFRVKVEYAELARLAACGALPAVWTGTTGYRVDARRLSEIAERLRGRDIPVDRAA